MTQASPGARPGFFGALAMPFRGIAFIAKNPDLARIWVVPVLIVVALLFLGCVGSANLGAAVANHYVPRDETGDILAQYSTGFGHAIARALVTMIAMAFSVLFAIIVAPLVAAPFNEALGEAVELRQIGREPPAFSWARVGRDLSRTLRLEVVKLGFYLVVVGPLTVFGFLVSPLATVASVVGFLFTAVYFALDYIDGPLTRRSIGVRRRFALIAEHPAAMFGFGLGVWVLLVIPLVNLFFMPAAVAGGTMLCMRLGLLEQVESTNAEAEEVAA